MVHRALFGSFERFIGILLEHYDGAFPLWLAPEAVRVLPIGGADEAYAADVAAALIVAGVRADVCADGPLGGRIRDAEIARVPVMAVVGAREREAGAVCLRRRGQRQQQVLERGAAIAALGAEVASRSR